MVILSDKVDFKTRNTIRNKEKHFIMIKESVHQKDVTILNLCVLIKINFKIKKAKLIKIKGELNKSQS